MISRRSRKAGAVIEAILILAGLGFLIKAGMTGTSTYRFIHAAPAMDGTINGIEHYGFTLDVEISPGAGESYIFAQDALPYGHQVGDQVEVFFDPNNPSYAMMSDFTAVWCDSIALALAGFILAGLGFRMRATRNI